MLLHGVGQALAAAQASDQKLEAVGLVGRRAGGADRGSSVAAGLEQGGVRLPLGRVDRADLTRLGVCVLDPAA
jgi:hypothetical protein